MPQLAKFLKFAQLKLIMADTVFKYFSLPFPVFSSILIDAPEKTNTHLPVLYLQMRLVAARRARAASPPSPPSASNARISPMWSPPPSGRPTLLHMRYPG